MTNLRAVLVLGSLAVTAISSERLAAAEADKPRELLQPPKSTIASPITDRFALRGIYFQPTIDMPLRYDSSPLLQGTAISGEDTLGFDDEMNQGMLEMTFRLTDKHRIRADFYKMTRSGDVVLDQLVRFGDDTYRVSDRVVSAMDLRMLGLTYTYSLLRRERIELAAGLGLHLMQAEGEAEVPARLLRENFDVAGPFATLAVDATWRMTKRFSLNIRGQYLGGNVDAIDGCFLELPWRRAVPRPTQPGAWSGLHPADAAGRQHRCGFRRPLRAQVAGAGSLRPRQLLGRLLR